MTGLDWAGLMRTGFVGLKLSPSEFWALTPAEFALMTGVGRGAAPMDRSGLEELVARFPDAVPKRNDHG